MPPTSGSEGTIAIPVRGKTSDDVFYRIHLRATDSSGLTTETARLKQTGSIARIAP